MKQSIIFLFIIGIVCAPSVLLFAWDWPARDTFALADSNRNDFSVLITADNIWTPADGHVVLLDSGAVTRSSTGIVRESPMLLLQHDRDIWSRIDAEDLSLLQTQEDGVSEIRTQIAAKKQAIFQMIDAVSWKVINPKELLPLHHNGTAAQVPLIVPIKQGQVVELVIPADAVDISSLVREIVVLYHGAVKAHHIFVFSEAVQVLRQDDGSLRIARFPLSSESAEIEIEFWHFNGKKETLVIKAP